MADIAFTLLMKFVTFYSIFGTSIVVLWIGKQSHEDKKITYPWVTFMSGIVGIASLSLLDVSELIKIIDAPLKFSLELVLIIVSTGLINLGAFNITKENVYKMNFLKNKYIETREILLRLGEKLERNEIPRKNYDTLVSHLKEELEDVEKKLNKKA